MRTYRAAGQPKINKGAKLLTGLAFMFVEFVGRRHFGHDSDEDARSHAMVKDSSAEDSSASGTCSDMAAIARSVTCRIELAPYL